MSYCDLADVAERNAQPELHLVDLLAGVLAPVHHQVELHACRTERVGVGDHAAVAVGGLGISVDERVVRDCPDRVVGGAPDLACGDGAEAALEAGVGESSAAGRAGQAGLGGVDLVFEAVDCGQAFGDLIGALDAPAGAAVGELGVAVVGGHPGAQGAVPGGFGRNN